MGPRYTHHLKMAQVGSNRSRFVKFIKFRPLHSCTIRTRGFTEPETTHECKAFEVL